MYGMYEIAKRRRVPLYTYAEGVVEAIIEGPPCLRGLQGTLRLVYFQKCSVRVEICSF